MVAAGAAAASTALLGFGLDSFVKVSSALVVVWQFRSRVPEFLAVAGLMVVVTGIAVTLTAQRQMGISCRVGVDPVGVRVPVQSQYEWPYKHPRVGDGADPLSRRRSAQQRPYRRSRSVTSRRAATRGSRQMSALLE